MRELVGYAGVPCPERHGYTPECDLSCCTPKICAQRVYVIPPATPQWKPNVPFGQIWGEKSAFIKRLYCGSHLSQLEDDCPGSG